MKGKSMKASGLVVANAATTELLDRLPGLQLAKNLSSLSTSAPARNLGVRR